MTVPYPDIGPFVGGYAMVDGGFFVDADGRTFRERSCNRNRMETVEELLPGGFARVRTADGDVLYRDFVTDMLWTGMPDGFLQLDFLHFFRCRGFHFLRVPRFPVPLMFRREDVWIEGDVFQRRNVYNGAGQTVFLHRAMPSVVFEFLGYNADRSKKLRPMNGDTYYYIYGRGGVRPVRTRERILPLDTAALTAGMRECLH